MIFYFLMFIRPAIKKLTNFLCAALLLGSVLEILDKQLIISAMFFVLAFILFLFGWFYDNLLLRLNPEQNILVLNR